MGVNQKYVMAALTERLVHLVVRCDASADRHALTYRLHALEEGLLLERVEGAGRRVALPEGEVCSPW